MATPHALLDEEYDSTMKRHALLASAASTLVAIGLLANAGSLSAEAVNDVWRYTLDRPVGDWTRPGFDDSQWKQAFGGFGTRGTPAARIGTRWDTAEIWLRKSFDLDAVPDHPALLIHHDEDVEVYLGGKRVVSLDGWSTEYKLIPLDPEHRDSIVAGSNLMAVHCRQTSGGQFIDVHLVDADRVPELPPAARSTKPFESKLVTRWGRKVTAENAWTEYPRPQLRRPQWQNLNGSWQYAVTADDVQQIPESWAGSILVPFALESKLGGVSRILRENEALWYRRVFSAQPRDDRRMLLHFEAVDYRCDVLVNGDPVGSHQGGHTPFFFDISDSIRGGENSLVVRVEDDTEGYQLRGKQVLDPHGIWYTQVSGIWQTVWTESVPDSYIRGVTIDTDASRNTIQLRTRQSGSAKGQTVSLTVRDDGRVVARGSGTADSLTVTVDEAKHWSPDSPHLYDLEISLIDEFGNLLDKVTSYCGIRSLGRQRDADGQLRFTLNGEPIFHWGPLDQGWWPDGLLTPPSDEAMRFDIEFLKQAGFNMIRKHIKVEPRRYYYHCDRIGMMVWQDHVSAGNNPPWTRLKPEPTDASWPDEHHEQFLVELERMIDTLENHPSIVVWVPFNEAWGQHRTVEVGQWLIKRDPSRPVNIASGGNFWPIGDIVDHHSYPHPDFPFDNDRFGDFIKVMGEFGGHGFPAEGHLWDADRRNWGYGGLPKTMAEYRDRYQTSIEKLDALRRRGIAAGVYTQTTDVEGEINGLMSYDREVIKIPAAELAELHRRLFEP